MEGRSRARRSRDSGIWELGNREWPVGMYCVCVSLQGKLCVLGSFMLDDAVHQAVSGRSHAPARAPADHRFLPTLPAHVVCVVTIPVGAVGRTGLWR